MTYTGWSGHFETRGDTKTIITNYWQARWRPLDGCQRGDRIILILLSYSQIFGIAKVQQRRASFNITCISYMTSKNAAKKNDVKEMWRRQNKNIWLCGCLNTVCSVVIVFLCVGYYLFCGWLLCWHLCNVIVSCNHDRSLLWVQDKVLHRDDKACFIIT